MINAFHVARQTEGPGRFCRIVIIISSDNFAWLSPCKRKITVPGWKKAVFQRPTSRLPNGHISPKGNQWSGRWHWPWSSVRMFSLLFFITTGTLSSLHWHWKTVWPVPVSQSVFQVVQPQTEESRRQQSTALPYGSVIVGCPVDGTPGIVPSHPVRRLSAVNFDCLFRFYYFLEAKPAGCFSSSAHKHSACRSNFLWPGGWQSLYFGFWGKGEKWKVQTGWQK